MLKQHYGVRDVLPDCSDRFEFIALISAIGSAGIDLYYLLFGIKTDRSNSISAEEQRRIEQTVFNLIEEYVQAKCAGRLSAEGRFVLFEVMRAHLTSAALQGIEPDLNIQNLLVGRS